MWSREENQKIEEYSTRIVQVIDYIDEYKRGDIESAVKVLVVSIITSVKNDAEENRIKEKFRVKPDSLIQKELDEFIEQVGSVKALERVAAQVDGEYQDGRIWGNKDKKTVTKWISEIEERIYDR